MASRHHAQRRRPRSIDFEGINRVAVQRLPSLLSHWLPDGRPWGNEWVARNPTRNDRRAGSFSVNMTTGRWADFALANARGGDVISLAAYLAGCSQADSARNLARMLGVDLYHGQ